MTRAQITLAPQVYHLPGEFMGRMQRLIYGGGSIAWVMACQYARNPRADFNWYPGTQVKLREHGFLTEDFQMTEETRNAINTLPKKEGMTRKELLRAKIEENKSAFLKAMPGGINANRIMEVATTAITSNPKLLECTTASLLGGVLKVCQLGLDINPEMQQAALVPMKRNRSFTEHGKKQWQTIHECTFWLMYKGMISLAIRSPGISDVDAYPVFQDDEFDYRYGTNKYISHKPTRKRGERTAEKLIAAYAVATLADGTQKFRVCELDEINQAMADSPSADQEDSVWRKRPIPMSMKTAVRRLWPYLPIQSVDIVATQDATLAKLDQERGLVAAEYQVEPEQAPVEHIDWDAPASEDSDTVKQDLGSGDPAEPEEWDTPEQAAEKERWRQQRAEKEAKERAAEEQARAEAKAALAAKEAKHKKPTAADLEREKMAIQAKARQKGKAVLQGGKPYLGLRPEELAAQVNDAEADDAPKLEMLQRKINELPQEYAAEKAKLLETIENKIAAAISQASN